MPLLLDQAIPVGEVADRQPGDEPAGRGQSLQVTLGLQECHVQPVREREHVFVWFASFPSADHHRGHLEQLQQSTQWTGRVRAELTSRLASPSRQLRLAPTPRSLLH